MSSRKQNLDLAILEKYLTDHPKINEVILSGGDPLMLSNHDLNGIIQVLNNRHSIKYIRIHTRAITTLPKRINQSFLNVIKNSNKFLAIVLHINHAAELTPLSKEKIAILTSNNIPLLSQSVLLRDINDDVNILKNLFHTLFTLKIQPYYLHQLDKIEGSAHFEVPVTRGIEIMKQLRISIPPYMTPRYVVDSKEGKANLYY